MRVINVVCIYALVPDQCLIAVSYSFIADTAVSNDYDRRFNVVSLIQDTLVVIRHLDGTFPAGRLTPPQQAMVDEPDACICTRELAPTRKLMAAHINNSFMRTRPGFFTALVFRNILFNSEAFLNCPPTLSKFQFSTFDEWTEYAENIRLHFKGRPVTFFCNPSALGQPISERTIDNASHFWEVSVKCEWPAVWPLKFANMYDLLGRIKDDLRLPGCGPLGLYLLCADMVRYGMVERPSLDEMADVIFNLRKGALSGLELLGYITRGNGPEGWH